MVEAWTEARLNAQIWIQWGVARGWSGVAILDALREVNLGYRMTNFYDDLRRIKGVGVESRYVKALPETSSVPRRYMVETPSEIWHIPEPHKGVFGVSLFDPETGEGWVETYDVGFDREITTLEAMSYVEKELPWSTYEPGMEIDAVELIGWKHKAGASY